MHPYKSVLLSDNYVPLQTPEEEEVLNKKRSKRTQKKYDERKKTAKISSLLEEQFQQGKLLGERLHKFHNFKIQRYICCLCIKM